MVEEVQAWKTDLMSQGEHIVVDMLVEIAEKMFGEGVELNPEALQINLNCVMESAHGLGDLNIFMNPSGCESFRPFLERISDVGHRRSSEGHPFGQDHPRWLFHQRNYGQCRRAGGNPIGCHPENIPGRQRASRVNHANTDARSFPF